ncbi:hypothetical protein PENSPDRAFT_674229 [Peniophora sp. CONT]|nr:hypothetical protein PENSPDRAFT_674229 [Peniophora sp. CONT]
MSNSTIINPINQSSSLCPANGRQTVGDGALCADTNASVLAVCNVQGAGDIYYYSTTFSGGPGVRSSDRVRDGPAPYIAAPESYPATRYGSPAPASIYPHPLPVKHLDKNTTPRVAPIGIPRSISKNSQQQPVPDSSTPPPLTPDSSYDSVHDQLPTANKKHNDALEILATLFPSDIARALPYAKRVTISSPEMPTALEGVVLALPGQTRTLYVNVKGAALVNLRENIVALLDLADECFECQALVIALEKAEPSLSSVLHALMYAGGAVVTKPVFKADPALVLVGLEI